MLVTPSLGDLVTFFGFNERPHTQDGVHECVHADTTQILF